MNIPGERSDKENDRGGNDFPVLAYEMPDKTYRERDLSHVTIRTENGGDRISARMPDKPFLEGDLTMK
jgi:hypothetical protein